MSNLAEMGLDPNVQASTGGYTLISTGKHKAVIVQDAVIDTAKKDGKIWHLKLQIIDGPFCGQTLEDWINILNPTLTNGVRLTERIGQGTVRRICENFGQPFPPADTTKFYGRPLLIEIEHQQGKDKKTGVSLVNIDGTPKMFHRIKGYHPVPQATQETQKTAPGGW